MNLHDLEVLEYNQILEKLSLLCKTHVGKNFAMQLKPSFKKEQVEKLLEETLEASILNVQKGSLPMLEIADISVSLKKLESNLSISAKAILDIALVLRLSRELKEYFYEDENFDRTSFVLLEDMFSKLYSNLDVENSIFSSILDENTIADTASSTLAVLRKNRKKLESQIKDSLNHILHSSQYSKAIMEPIITIRNDRYVIPVKEEFRGLIKGFIHDMSASGSTVFVEPLQVFELNNQIQSLKVEENAEIERILINLSNKLIPYLKELENNVYLIGKFDFIFAKASLAKSMEAVSPILTEEKQIDFKKACHPFIDKDKVVPIDIHIGKEYSSLIITGPNTGGKTVTLKTTGLLCLMAYSGLFIPTEEKSSLCVFDSVFADIGDEQSIEESLSTFSAHITNIIHITKESTSNSLILIDELGSGTDPIEGASLAISILEYFHKLGAITLTTTHYSEIKNYALVTDGFENASSAFDVENLKPTYKLLIGVPGKSNAFAISKKLGLSDDILKKAESLLKEDHTRVEDLLKNIYDDKIAIENEKEEIQKNLSQVEILRKSLEHEKDAQNEIKQNQIEKAKLEAKNILLSAKDTANDTIKELNALYENNKQLEEMDLENWSDSQISNFVKSHFKKGSLKKANELRQHLNNSFDSFSSFSDEAKNDIGKQMKAFKKEDLKVGMKLKLKNFSEVATITSLSGKKDSLQVQIGNAKMNVSLANIEEILEEKSNFSPSNVSFNASSSASFNVSSNAFSNALSNASSLKSSSKLTSNSYKSSLNSSFSDSSLKAKSVTTEINVIGQNVDEACFVIDKYLDDCYLAKVSPVRIVHGKGTGKLREGIHIFLRKHPHVKSFRLGTFGEGEMGVTIVELK